MGGFADEGKKRAGIPTQEEVAVGLGIDSTLAGSQTFHYDPAGLFKVSDDPTIRELQATLDIGGLGAKPQVEEEKRLAEQEALLAALGPKETTHTLGDVPTASTKTLGETDTKRKRRALDRQRLGTRQLQIPLEATTTTPAEGLSSTQDFGLKV